MSDVNWTDANQRLLVAEFARLRALLANEDSKAAELRLEAARDAMPSPPAIDILASAFGLSPFERDLLLLCAAVEMDGTFASQCATFALALARLPSPHWSATTPLRPLRRWRLVELQEDHSLTAARLGIDERILHFLAGINFCDTRLRALVSQTAAHGTLSEGHVDIASLIQTQLASRDGASTVVQLHGDDPTAQRSIASRVAAAVGLKLHTMNSADISTSGLDVDALGDLWSRESVLLGAALLVRVGDADSPALTRFLEKSGGLVFACGPRASSSWRHEFSHGVNKPVAIERRALWKEACGIHAERLNGSLDAIASQFRVSADFITRTADSINLGQMTPADLEATLMQACRESVRTQLDVLAHRVEVTTSWDDLILPDAQLATLRHVVAHVRQRQQVYHQWGFAGKSCRGLGTSVLFTGESGTGKTMAAEVLAHELQLDLYRIDLASMVSKYIGETEKNLRRIFDAAEDSGAILLFDEADALFGKRSEVKDSHDRYANIEVSYLLQRMETYGGLAILTTNIKSSLDIAFQRRLRFVVSFPFPDATLRERIWRGVMPAATPLDRIDYPKLAQLNVPGGNIRNIALNAAFIAAEQRASVGMNHLLLAARSEAAKRDRPFSEAEVRGWA